WWRTRWLRPVGKLPPLRLRERSHGLQLHGDLRPLEESLQPAQDLGLTERELLERPLLDVRRELVELLEQLAREGVAQLVVDLGMQPAEVVDGSGFRTDPPRLLEHLARHGRDPDQTLRVDRGRLGRARPGRSIRAILSLGLRLLGWFGWLLAHEQPAYVTSRSDTGTHHARTSPPRACSD